jgi:hypothetical protein
MIRFRALPWAPLLLAAALACSAAQSLAEQAPAPAPAPLDDHGQLRDPVL